MTLNDAIAAGLPFLRAEAEARMLSTATVRRRTGAMMRDANGYETPEWVLVIGSTPLRLAGTAANSAPYKTLTPGNGTLNVAARVAHLPATTTGLANDDFLEVTSGVCAGTVWRLIEVTWQDQATALRIPVEQMPYPSEWGETP